MQVEFILLILSLLFFVSIIADKIGYKFGVPALLLFLIVGMLFGSDGIGALFGGAGLQIDTENAQALSTVAMCIILFTGGMDTKLSDVKSVLAPGVTLATVGVLMTCVITGGIIYYIFGWLHAVATVSIWMALLMAATMSSTDSASVFSIMRTNGIGLKHDLRPLLELEVLGFALGEGLVLLLRRVQLANEALYPIMVLTACIFIFGITHYLQGNTYLAVYVGGLIIGNNKFTRKRQTKAFFNGLAWLSQLVMFLMLGLMVQPKEFIHLNVWLPCLIISLVMICISRPIAVWLCMLPFKRWRTRDRIMLSWVGLKGAVPVIFGVMCKAQGVPNADIILNVIFLCTIISLIVQGTSLSVMARKLKLATPPQDEKRLIHFDMDLPDEIQSTAREVEVTADMIEFGNTPSKLQIPPHTLIILVRRGEDFFVPTGASALEVGDQLLVISDQDAEASFKQLANEAEEEAQWRAEMKQKAKKRWMRATQWMRRDKKATSNKEGSENEMNSTNIE